MKDAPPPPWLLTFWILTRPLFYNFGAMMDRWCRIPTKYKYTPLPLESPNLDDASR